VTGPEVGIAADEGDREGSAWAVGTLDGSPFRALEWEALEDSSKPAPIRAARAATQTKMINRRGFFDFPMAIMSTQMKLCQERV
jgi:hypothetical protein